MSCRVPDHDGASCAWFFDPLWEIQDCLSHRKGSLWWDRPIQHQTQFSPPHCGRLTHQELLHVCMCECVSVHVREGTGNGSNMWSTSWRWVQVLTQSCCWWCTVHRHLSLSMWFRFEQCPIYTFTHIIPAFPLTWWTYSTLPMQAAATILPYQQTDGPNPRGKSYLITEISWMYHCGWLDG